MNQSTCSVEGCEKLQLARGWCGTHYQRWRAHGDPLFTKHRAECTVEGCAGKHSAVGYCNTHHRRFLKYGDANHLERSPNEGTCEAPGCTEPMRKLTYCASHYQMVRRYGVIREHHYKWSEKAACCITCGGQMGDFKSRIYCSSKCYMRARRGSEGYAEPRRAGGPCLVEGCERTAVGRGWCGSHYSQWKRTGLVLPLPVFIRCATCGEPFEDASRRRRFCSDSCQQIMSKRGPRPAAVLCTLCAEPIDLVTRRKTGRLQPSTVLVCLECRNKSTRRYPVTREWLSERDGNACHLCSAEIDFTLQHPDAMSASTDHVIPVSRGGSSQPSNLALAHLVCNIRKGNRVLT